VSVNKNQIAKVGFNVGMLLGSAVRHVRLAAGCCTMAQEHIEKVQPQLDPNSLGAQNLAALAAVITRFSAQLEAASVCVHDIDPEKGPEVRPPAPLEFPGTAEPTVEGGA
jgi:hypothetical protein